MGKSPSPALQDERRERRICGTRAADARAAWSGEEAELGRREGLSGAGASRRERGR